MRGEADGGGERERGGVARESKKDERDSRYEEG